MPASLISPVVFEDEQADHAQVIADIVAFAQRPDRSGSGGTDRSGQNPLA
jgi:hypothetical protein